MAEKKYVFARLKYLHMIFFKAVYLNLRGIAN
jgi:hypothetical protein